MRREAERGMRCLTQESSPEVNSALCQALPFACQAPSWRDGVIEELALRPLCKETALLRSQPQTTDVQYCVLLLGLVDYKNRRANGQMYWTLRAGSSPGTKNAGSHSLLEG